MNSIVTQRFIHCHHQLKQDNRVRSSRQFALALDYLPQSLSEILKGRRDVTIDLLRRAVEVYQINPIYLYTGEGGMFLKAFEEEDVQVLTVLTDPHSDEKILYAIQEEVKAIREMLGEQHHMILHLHNTIEKLTNS